MPIACPSPKRQEKQSVARRVCKVEQQPSASHHQRQRQRGRCRVRWLQWRERSITSRQYSIASVKDSQGRWREMGSIPSPASKTAGQMGRGWHPIASVQDSRADGESGGCSGARGCKSWTTRGQRSVVSVPSSASMTARADGESESQVVVLVKVERRENKQVTISSTSC